MVGEWTTPQIVTVVLTLLTFLGAQAVALFIWYRKHKADREREIKEQAKEQQFHRKEQLADLKKLIDRDIGSVKEEVGGLRERLESYEEVQRDRNEQLHGHLRRIENDRPTRGEMNKEIAHLRNDITSVKEELTRSVDAGFHNLNRRFDEFKEYARDLWGKPKE